MEGVRRNIALKLKPSLGKEGGSHRSPGEGGKKKEGVDGPRVIFGVSGERSVSAAGGKSGREPPTLLEEATVSSPAPPTSAEFQVPSPRQHLLRQPEPPSTDSNSPIITTTITASVSGKIPPDSITETGWSPLSGRGVNVVFRRCPPLEPEGEPAGPGSARPSAPRL